MHVLEIPLLKYAILLHCTICLGLYFVLNLEILAKFDMRLKLNEDSCFNVRKTHPLFSRHLIPNYFCRFLLTLGCSSSVDILYLNTKNNLFLKYFMRYMCYFSRKVKNFVLEKNGHLLMMEKRNKCSQTLPLAFLHGNSSCSKTQNSKKRSGNNPSFLSSHHHSSMAPISDICESKQCKKYFLCSKYQVVTTVQRSQGVL